MDYEKMYKAVLKTATQWIEDGCSDKEKICLESIFPELRESEDERIIVRLIEYFQGFLEGYEDCYKDGGCVKWEGLDVKSILAWLEKQKETANSFTDGVIEVRSFQRGIAEGRRLERQKECVADSSKTSANEDESIRKFLVDYFTSYKIGNVATKLNGVRIDDILNYLEKQKEQKHPNGCFTCDEYKKGYEEGRRNGFTAGYNKAMKEVEQKEQKPVVTHGETYHVDTLGTQQVIAGKMPQKPAEWSEEDEIYLQDALWCVEKAEKSCKDEEDKGSCWSAKRWLKSLRPSWKPSEEQMEALKCAVADIARFSKRGGRQVELENEPYYSALHSLYCNLEKLM